MWNISEMDRLCYVFGCADQNHADVLFFQSPEDAASPLAVGVGHDDGSLCHTFRDLVRFTVPMRPAGTYQSQPRLSGQATSLSCLVVAGARVLPLPDRARQRGVKGSIAVLKRVKW